MVVVDMNMPKNCEDCWLFHWSMFGTDFNYCMVIRKNIKYPKEIPSWCPITELDEDDRK